MNKIRNADTADNMILKNKYNNNNKNKLNDITFFKYVFRILLWSI